MSALLSCPVRQLLIPFHRKAALRSADEQTSAKHENRADSGLSPSSNKAVVSSFVQINTNFSRIWTSIVSTGRHFEPCRYRTWCNASLGRPAPVVRILCITRWKNRIGNSHRLQSCPVGFRLFEEVTTGYHDGVARSPDSMRNSK